MAHIDHSFQMAGDPDAAQALFMRDVTPSLARHGSFHVVREHAGQLVFDDALTEADVYAPGEQPGLGDEEDLSVPPPASEFIGPGSTAEWTMPRSPGSPSPPGRVEHLLARHLHVDFAASGSGTAVRVHGHVRRNLRDALQLLGTTGHWPETADRPHD